MRLGSLVDALCEDHQVTLLIVSTDPAITNSAINEYWRSRCANVVVCNVATKVETPRSKITSKEVFQRLASREPKNVAIWPVDTIVESLGSFRDQQFDSVLVSRLHMMPVWNAIESKLALKTKQAILDMDDIESLSLARQIEIAGMATLGKIFYFLERLESRKLAMAEARAFRKMDRLLICSDQDKEILERRLGKGKIHVVPNTIRLSAQLPPHSKNEVTRLLFVGTLNYPPNEDAIRWLLSEILPEIDRRLGPGLVRLCVVGKQPPSWMCKRSTEGEFDLFSDVPDVMPYYADAHFVVVPIRAGSGTRIKILEAFGYGRLVLSTRIGAEGIQAEDGEEFLLADTAQTFTDALTRVLQDSAYANGMVEKARKLVIERYSFESCVKALGFAMI